MGDWQDLVVRIGYRLAYLTLRAWWWARRPATHGTGVALWHEGKILLVQTSYRSLFSLPGGFVKGGESSNEAARRELLEELGIGLAADRLRLAWQGTLRFESRLDTTDIWEIRLESPPRMRFDGREIVWAGWMNPSESLKKPLLPHVGLYLAQIQGLDSGLMVAD